MDSEHKECQFIITLKINKLTEKIPATLSDIATYTVRKGDLFRF